LTVPSIMASMFSCSLNFLFNMFIFVIISPLHKHKVYTYINFMLLVWQKEKDGVKSM
jgi:hypothetical protein